MSALIFLDYFTPAYKAGGPIRVFEAVARSSSSRSAVYIVTQNQDWGDPNPLEGVPQNSWHKFENAQVLYTSPDRRSLRGILSVIRERSPQVIHLNSLFSRTWTMKILLLRRLGLIKGTSIHLSPHGELASSALGLKAWRKTIFLGIAKAIGLYRDVLWIATSPKEIDEIRSNIGTRTQIELVLPPMPPIHKHLPAKKVGGELKLVFLARLSAMKNLGFLLQVLPHVRGKVQFDIYGPIDAEYVATWTEVFARLRKDCPSVTVDYKGPIPSSETAKALAAYDLFVQPSLSENFGYSIVEALAAGTPVLISDQTPWNETNQERIGAAVALTNPKLWIEELQKFIDMDLDEWRLWSERAQTWIENKNASGEALLKIYSSSSVADSANAPALR